MSSIGSAFGLRSVRRTAIALMTVAGLMLSRGPVSAEEQLKFTLKDARITIVAQNVTLQEILAEWTRVGQTEFVGADTLRDQRVTAQLFEVPEAHALEVLLRSTAGYLARYRTGRSDSASSFDRVRIVARTESSTPPRSTSASVPTLLEQSENSPPSPAITATHGMAKPPGNEQGSTQLPNGSVVHSAREAGAGASKTQETAPVPRFAPLSPLERAGQRLNRPVPQGPAAPSTPPATTQPAAPLIPSNPFYNPPRPK